MSSSDKKKIVIVDDHPIMQKGLAMTLDNEINFEVTGLFYSAEEVLNEIEALSPDLAIVDISLPGMNGLELIKHLVATQPELKILVLSRHDELLYATRVLKAGAKGYLMKVEAGERLIKALHKISNGGIYVTPKIQEKMLMSIAANGSALSSNVERLSDRELEVFEAIGEGLSTQHIANKLHLSVKTIESYRTRIKSKLNVNNATELLRHAVNWVEQ